VADRNEVAHAVTGETVYMVIPYTAGITKKVLEASLVCFWKTPKEKWHLLDENARRVKIYNCMYSHEPP
jgi:hypothetical protein